MEHEKVIIIRYGELHLKGANRGFFEKLLKADIKQKLKGMQCEFISCRGRYIVSNFADVQQAAILTRLCRVFGLHSMSVALKVTSDLSAINSAALILAKDKKGRFKAEANRADKKFPLNSIQLCTEVGAFLLENNLHLSVDLHTPEFTVKIDVREEGHTFVFCDAVAGAGGMPLGSAGKGLLMLSGGLDSPVAGYLMARRGLYIAALHFHSYPYTGEKAIEKVRNLAGKLSLYAGRIKLINLKITAIQEAIKKHCADEYQITLLRVCMMRLSQRVAELKHIGCIINGESLGQVASQTLESIGVTGFGIDLPVFRPLIGMDKQEIIDKARAIDTFNISIQPFEDCCTVFLPPHPVTRPSLAKARLELAKIINLDKLMDEALNSIETDEVYCE